MFHITKQNPLPITHRSLQRGRCVSFGICILVLCVPCLFGIAFPADGDPEPPLTRDTPRIYNIIIRVEPTSKTSLGWPYVEKTNWITLDASSFRVTNKVNTDLPYTYEQLKNLSRGASIDEQAYKDFIKSLQISSESSSSITLKVNTSAWLCGK